MNALTAALKEELNVEMVRFHSISFRFSSQRGRAENQRRCVRFSWKHTLFPRSAHPFASGIIARLGRFDKTFGRYSTFCYILFHACAETVVHLAQYFALKLSISTNFLAIF